MDQLNPEKMILIIFTALMISPLRASDHIYERDQYVDLSIDCGANGINRTNYNDDNFFVPWSDDEQFIKTGENKLLPSNYTKFQMNTLRYFPKGNKNCYKLPFYDRFQKYMFRAAFLYGNYDLLSKPPSFGLEIDGKFWTNVTTSMSDEPVYHELLYINPRKRVHICLIRTRDDQVPVISSLEAVNFYMPDWYKLMKNDTLMNLHSRVNYGANQSVEQSMDSPTDPDSDPLPRTWQAKEMSNYLSIHSVSRPFGYIFGENAPPEVVMYNAIQATNLTNNSIYFPIDFSSQISSQAYFVFYFMDPVYRQDLSNETCTVEIYIDDKRLAVADVPNVYMRNVSEAEEYRVISLYPVTVGITGNVTISRAENSTLAPILNAMEIYWAMDVSNAANGLLNFIHLVLVVCFHLIFVLSY